MIDVFPPDSAEELGVKESRGCMKKSTIVEKLLNEGTDGEQVAKVIEMLPHLIRSVKRNTDMLAEVLGFLSAYKSHPDKIVGLFHPRSEAIDQLKEALRDLSFDGDVSGNYLDIIEKFESKAVVAARMPE